MCILAGKNVILDCLCFEQERKWDERNELWMAERMFNVRLFSHKTYGSFSLFKCAINSGRSRSFNFVSLWSVHSDGTPQWILKKHVRLSSMCDAFSIIGIGSVRFDVVLGWAAPNLCTVKTYKWVLAQTCWFWQSLPKIASKSVSLSKGWTILQTSPHQVLKLLCHLNLPMVFRFLMPFTRVWIRYQKVQVLHWENRKIWRAEEKFGMRQERMRRAVAVVWIVTRDSAKQQV